MGTLLEMARKDVECCFGLLQARFAIIGNPCRQWSIDTTSNIMLACCIVQNMIVEDESDKPRLEDMLPMLGDNVQMHRDSSFGDLLTHIIEIENEDTLRIKGRLNWALVGD